MLHFAPEPFFASRFKTLIGSGYLSADLLDPSAMAQIDITSIPYHDHHFDVVYCCHVLEHIPDDRKAIREIGRVLDPKGFAVILVPLTLSNTFEDPTVTTPAERARLFGQVDHVRRYGPDFVERLRDSGLLVQPVTPLDICSGDERRRHSLLTTDVLYFCRTTPPSSP